MTTDITLSDERLNNLLSRSRMKHGWPLSLFLDCYSNKAWVLQGKGQPPGSLKKKREPRNRPVQLYPTYS